MAIYYVDSGATAGANNGTSKADAYLSVGSLPALTVSDQVFISHTHSESSAITILPGDTGQEIGVLPYLVSVDFSGSTPPVEADYTRGATIANTSGNLSFTSSGQWHGVIIQATVDITIQAGDEIVVLRDCGLFAGPDDDWLFSMNGNGKITLIDTVFGGTQNTSADNLGGMMVDTGEGSNVLMIGCSADSSLQWKDELVRVATRPGSVTMIGCDWSNWGTSAGTHTICGGTTEWGVTFIGCQFQTGATMASGASGISAQGAYRFIDCGLNNNTDQEQGEYWDYYHQIETYGGGQTNRAVYRSSGFTPPHQTNPISLRVTEPTAGNADPSHPTRIPLGIYNTATAATKTITVEFIAADGTSVDALDYTELWLEVLYYDNTGTLLRHEHNWESPIKSSPTAHAAGVGVGNWTLTNAETNRNSYKLALTTTGTIGQEGFIHVFVCVGDIGTNDAIYIDPMVTIS